MSFLRSNVLSPLALNQNSLTLSGVRNIETRLPEFSEELKMTVRTADKHSLIKAFDKCISIYLELRKHENVIENIRVQKLCMDYFKKELKY